MASFKPKYILLATLTLVAFLTRVIKQLTVPYGFHRDEAGIAYSAYSILKTGRDEWGRLLPLHFKALGDYPPGVYNYLTAGFTAVVGPGPVAERLPAIVFGSLLVPLVYLFLKQVFNQPQIGLIAASLVVFNPWFVVQSRSGGEPIVALFFSLLGLIGYYRYLTATNKTKKLCCLIGMALSYFLALYTYNATRAVLPLLHLLISWYHWPLVKKKENQLRVLIISGLILILSLATIFVTSQSAMRLNSLSVWNQIQTQSFQALYDREGHHQLPIILSRMFHNKYIALIKTVLSNFFQHFSFGFLFNDSGRPLRYLVPKVGQLHLLMLPFLVLGLVSTFKLKLKEKIFLGLMSLIAVMPAAITVEDLPHVKRSMYLFLPLLVFTAHGLVAGWSWIVDQAKLVKLSLILSFCLIFTYSLGLFINQYLIHTKYETAVHRSYGYLQAFELLKDLEQDYQTVNIYENNDAPHVYYLLVNQYDPAKYQRLSQQNQANLFSDSKQTWQIGKYTFIPGACPDQRNLKSDQLYLTKAECRLGLKDLIEVLQVVDLPEGTAKLAIFKGQK